MLNPRTHQNVVHLVRRKEELARSRQHRRHRQEPPEPPAPAALSQEPDLPDPSTEGQTSSDPSQLLRSSCTGPCEEQKRRRITRSDFDEILGRSGEVPSARRAPVPSKPAEKSILFSPIEPRVKLDALGGISAQKELLMELIQLPITCADAFSLLGADPVSGILLHGVPGTGKTALAHAMAGSFNVPFFAVSATELVSGVSGESEATLRSLFESALAAAPALLFLDELDVIAGRREDFQRDMSRRIVAELMQCFDRVRYAWTTQRKVVIVLGATNRIESIDPALRRSGRFDREVGLGIPNPAGRAEILRHLCQGSLRVTLNKDEGSDFEALAARTCGYVAADLHAVTKEAGVLAVRRYLSNGRDESTLSITFADLEEATRRVQPSALREGFTVAPDVTWSDVGALHGIREQLLTCIVHPIRFPNLYRRLGVTQSLGVLLHGPPGCGKTLLAKAVAREAGANFISVKGPELLNKYVGESERGVRSLFARARTSAPCVLFFDELDALAPRRSDGGSGASDNSTERVVNQLLTEMDGIDARDVLGVYVIGATNRVDRIDPALRRPGRLDKVLYVPLPDANQRFEILTTLAKKYPLADDALRRLRDVADDPRCEGLSGADLGALLRESALSVLRNILQDGKEDKVHPHHPASARWCQDQTDADTTAPRIPWSVLDEALNTVRPSVRFRGDKTRDVEGT